MRVLVLLLSIGVLATGYSQAQSPTLVRLGTVIPAGKYLLIAASPPALMAATGQGNVLGPFTSRLSNAAIRLLSRVFSTPIARAAAVKPPYSTTEAKK